MKLFVTSIMLGAGVATTAVAGGSTAPTGDFGFSISQDATTWLAQGNGKAKGNQKAKGHKADKPGKATKSAIKNDRPKSKPDKARGNGKPDKVSNAAKGNGGKVRGADWDERARNILQVEAPANRDMRALLGAGLLALAGPQLVIANTPTEELITYRNCPPGLAKKEPACVPPGLAKKGVTQSEWLSYEDDDYDRLWRERRDVYLQDSKPSTSDLLLQSSQIATLFGLDNAPDNSRYALIDGMPVLLDEDDYNGLLLINELANVPGAGNGANIAPTAALTQDELRQLYRLPATAPDQNYTVLNGQLISLNDSQYETLQLIRIARAVL